MRNNADMDIVLSMEEAGVGVEELELFSATLSTTELRYLTLSLDVLMSSRDDRRPPQVEEETW